MTTRNAKVETNPNCIKEADHEPRKSEVQSDSFDTHREIAKVAFVVKSSSTSQHEIDHFCGYFVECCFRRPGKSNLLLRIPCISPISLLHQSLTVPVVAQKADDDLRAKSKQYLKDCQAEVGATEEDLEPFRKKTKPESYKSKCVLACMNDKFEFVSFITILFGWWATFWNDFIILSSFLGELQTTNGYVNNANVADLANRFYPNAEQATTWIESTRECTDLKSADRCDRAWELAECIFASIRRRGADPKTFFI